MSCVRRSVPARRCACRCASSISASPESAPAGPERRVGVARRTLDAARRHASRAAAAPLKTFPGVHLQAFDIREFAEQDEQEVDDGPDAEAAEREQLGHGGGGLADVETVRTEQAEQQ